MLKTLFVVMTEEHAPGKYRAHAEKWEGAYNLLDLVDRHPKAITLNACTTFKQATEIAEDWNECYKKNGTLWDFREV